MTEPAPLDRGRPLRGRELRHAALAVLHRHGPMLLPELLAAFTADGFTVAGTAPNKTLSDALRHEVALGRAQRVERGCYATARLARSTAWRIQRRWRHAITGPTPPPPYPTNPHPEPTPRTMGATRQARYRATHLHRQALRDALHAFLPGTPPPWPIPPITSHTHRHRHPPENQQ